jgi:hypothetical protein
MRSTNILPFTIGPALLLGACYVERPLATPVPVATTRIVAQITDTGSAAMASKIGPGAREVEGVVVDADGTAWDLQVIRVDYRGGTSTLWNRERVTFPRYALTNASERAFNKKKSWVVAGLITGTALLAARLFGALGFGGGSGGEPPPPN